MEVKEEYKKIIYQDEKVKKDLIMKVMLNWGLSKIGKREKRLMFWLVFLINDKIAQVVITDHGRLPKNY